MVEFFLWYGFITFLGLVSFPITYKLLPFLNDKGYSISRIVGLLIWSYLFWLFTSFGILSNDINGALIALLMFISLSSVCLRQVGWLEIKQWMKKQVKIIVVIELLFLLSFGFWTLLRSINPEIQGTEKPMEMAFINSISRSPTFPPNDPWLSGYAISYYYFGYIMIALLGYITGTVPAISYNLAISAWFALTALGCYGVVLNLLKTWQGYLHPHSRKNQENPFVYSSLLGPVYVLIISNLEGFLEMLHAKGLFWNKNPDGSLTSKFWSWLNIQELNQPPSLPFSLIPHRDGGVWWWRASRVLQDFDVAGGFKEVIDEFPFFSYFLGDLHPHVLAMPLGLLVIMIGVNLFRGQKKYTLTPSISGWIKSPFVWFAGLSCGGIIFANTWDLPIYLGILSILYLVIRIKNNGWKAVRIWETVKAALIIVGLSIFLFLLFFIGFASQAGGILPSLNFFTPGKYFWVMFFPFLSVFTVFLIVQYVKRGNKYDLMRSVGICSGFVILLGFTSYGIAWLIGNSNNILLSLPGIIGNNSQGFTESISNLVNSFIGVHGGIPVNEVIRISLINRLKAPFALLTLLFISSYCCSFLISLVYKVTNDTSLELKDSSYGIFPILILIFIGALFCIIPEFYYLRDVFGTRMNTIFKFYFQSWIVWGLAAASATVILWMQLKNVPKKIYTISLVLILCFSCAYPAFGLLEKMRGLDFHELNLDGSMFMKRYNSDEYEAIQWLKTAPYGTLAEAVGGSYSAFARISTFSGLPTVLGWPGHEMQWRGGVKEIGSRESDIRMLYETGDWQIASEIINRYKIQYIYVGQLEKNKYQVDISKFANRAIKVFSNDSVSIYQCFPN